MKAVLCLCLVLVFVSTSSALKCYQCENCQKEDQVWSSCLPGFDVCLTSRLSDKIRKSCAPSNFCNIENIDRDSLDPNKNAKGLFSDHNMKKMMKANLYTKGKLVHCCGKDFCNRSSRRIINHSLLCLSHLVLLLKALSVAP
ncbi:CD59B glycoprotein-like [Macrobrachium nipponense]|uniref:CD59B glycoprotein-like n=1 Tax=Macrobrachium nipponense TaxID=159736 RepID=UPI0030C82C66